VRTASTRHRAPTRGCVRVGRGTRTRRCTLWQLSLDAKTADATSFGGLYNGWMRAAVARASPAKRSFTTPASCICWLPVWHATSIKLLLENIVNCTTLSTPHFAWPTFNCLHSIDMKNSVGHTKRTIYWFRMSKTNPIYLIDCWSIKLPARCDGVATLCLIQTMNWTTRY
jgi:hypothetical protein